MAFKRFWAVGKNWPIASAFAPATNPHAMHDVFDYVGDVCGHLNWGYGTGVLHSNGDGTATFVNGGPRAAVGTGLGSSNYFVEFTVVSGGGNLPMGIGWDGENHMMFQLRPYYLTFACDNPSTFGDRSGSYYNVGDRIRIQQNDDGIALFANGVQTMGLPKPVNSGPNFIFYNVNISYDGTKISDFRCGPL